ncbi:MAG: hypothetical protein FWC91_00810 [Defluviitaleaceae bacterium]|nr:hypothetical protein [Defluviitaleaceae bacterium]
MFNIAGIRMIWIALAAAGVVCTGVAAVYGPPLAKNIVPEFFIARAVIPIAQEIMSDIETMQNLVVGLQENPWRQDATFGLSHLSGNITQNIDSTMLSAASLASLRSALRWDNVQEAYAAEISLQVAVTTLASASFQLDRGRIAANIPMLFDYYIAANPHSLVSDWNDSVFGNLSSFFITDDTFYETYRAIFFDHRDELQDIDFSKFLESLRSLPEYITFEYVGQDIYDEYLVTIPMERINESLRIFQETITDTVNMPVQVALNGDLAISLFIDGSRLIRANFRGPGLFDGALTFSDRNVFEFEISVNAEHQMFNKLDIWGDWFGNVISLNFNFDDFVRMNSVFTLLPERNRIEAHIRELNLVNDDMNATINVRYAIYTDTSPIVIDRENERLLTRLNLLDLGAITVRALNSPLGELLGNLIW